MLLHFIERAMLKLANIINTILPPVRFFKLKVFLYNLGGCNLSRNVKITSGTTIHYSNISIDDGTWIGSNVNFYSSIQGKIIIGKNNDVAPHVVINTGTHEIGCKNRRAGTPKGNDIKIGNGCWIGLGAIILSGAKVGNGCVIAAGSVVKDNFPDNVLIAGVPAKVKKQL